MEIQVGKKFGRAGLSYETCVKELKSGDSSTQRFFKKLNLYLWVKTRSVGGDINQLVCSLNMRLFRYQLNREDPIGWQGAVKITPYWVVKRIGPWMLQVLHLYVHNLPQINNAGHHFTTMGGKERVLYRWRCHGAKCDQPKFLKKCEEDEAFLESEILKEMNRFPAVKIDESFPKYMRDNLDSFRSIDWVAD